MSWCNTNRSEVGCGRPRMVIVADPPGSGKTTRFPLAEFGVDSFNADYPAAQLNARSSRGIKKRSALKSKLSFRGGLWTISPEEKALPSAIRNAFCRGAWSSRRSQYCLTIEIIGTRHHSWRALTCEGNCGSHQRGIAWSSCLEGRRGK